MTETPSAGIDAPTEEWQLGEILDGISDVEAGKVVSHNRVAKWLRSWGKPFEGKPPI